MRSEWQFTLAARGCRFERGHTYSLTSTEPVELEGAYLPSIDCQMTVTPLDYPTPDDVHQYVRLGFEIPLPPEKCEGLAHHLAHATAERLAFHARADIRVTGGLIAYKRMPETPEEEAGVGDRPYGLTLRLVEVVGTASFEELGGMLDRSAVLDPGLLGQFNDTARNPRPIPRFLGFFRILESFAHCEPVAGSLKSALKANAELRNRFSTFEPTKSFDDFVDAIVDARHECAHLKLGRNFGYVPADPRVEKQLLPHLALLEELASSCVAAFQQQSR